MDKMRQEVRNGLAFMTYAPILFISAKTGQRVDRLFELIDYVSNQASTRITTGMLNSVLADALPGCSPLRQGPPAEDLLHDPGGHPATPLCGVLQRRRLFHFSYQRYLENCSGTPLAWRARLSPSPSARRARRRMRSCWIGLVSGVHSHGAAPCDPGGGDRLLLRLFQRRGHRLQSISCGTTFASTAAATRD